MRSVLALLLVGIGILIITSASPISAQDGEDLEEAVLRGSVLYVQYCGACHGPEGEAVASGDGFTAITDYDPNFVRGRVTNGYDANLDDGIAMPAYGEDDGGPLSEGQIDDLLAYMGTWNNPEVETPPLPEPNIEPGEREAVTEGDKEHGAELYAYNCLGCHGEDTRGLDLDNFPAFEIDENAIRVVATGDGHGIVPAFAENNGGPLSQSDLTDLQAYLETIEVEEESERPEGVDILIIVLGLGAVLAVGGAYLAATRRKAV